MQFEKDKPKVTRKVRTAFYKDNPLRQNDDARKKLLASIQNMTALPPR